MSVGFIYMKFHLSEVSPLLSVALSLVTMFSCSATTVAISESPVLVSPLLSLALSHHDVQQPLLDFSSLIGNDLYKRAPSTSSTATTKSAPENCLEKGINGVMQIYR